MKWSNLLAVFLAIAVTISIVYASTENNEHSESKDKKSEERVKFGNQQNRISKGMFDDELSKSGQNNELKDSAIKPEDIEDDDEQNDEDTTNNEKSADDSSQDMQDFNDVMSPYFTRNFNDRFMKPVMNTGNWDDYDKYYYYDRQGDGNEPRVLFRKKRNMASPSNALKRTPRKRTQFLHTPLEQLMRARNGLKRSARMKRDLPPYYQQKLSELLTLMAINEAKEEAVRENYLRSLPMRVQEQILNREQEREEAQEAMKELYPYRLPPYVAKQLRNEDVGSDGISLDNSGPSLTNDDNENINVPSFFRKPYDRRSDQTFYPAPSAYQWLLSGQKKRSVFRHNNNMKPVDNSDDEKFEDESPAGRWGQINDDYYYPEKKSTSNSYYDEQDENGDDGDLESRLDPAKLYLFASLLDGEDQVNIPRDSRMPLRKRLIL